MGIDFKRPRHVRGFRLGEVLVWDFTSKPLVEKTASGSIVTFSDGADDVPLKSCEVALSASIDGYSSVDVVQTGKNLLPSLVDGVYEGNGVKAVVVGGVATLSGTTTSSGNAFSIPLTHEFVTPTQHAYIHLCNSAVNASAAPSFEDSSDVGNTNVSASFSPVNRVYSIPSEKRGVTWNRVRFYLGSGVTLSGTFSPMVCYENTASSYEPYVAPTTHTASLGRTIYGGTADIVNGAGTSGYNKVDLGSLTWQYDSANTRFFTVKLTGVIKRGSSGWITDLAIDYPYAVASGTANDKTVSEYASTGYVYIKDTDYTDTTAFKASLSGKYLTYPLATPTDFTFDGQEIPTRLGYNAFWSDSGDTEVIYYAYAD